MARPSYFKLARRRSAHPSPGGMIYKGLKTSWKSAGDKLRISFPLKFQAILPSRKIPLGLVLVEDKAAVPKVQHSMTVFDGHG